MTAWKTPARNRWTRDRELPPDEPVSRLSRATIQALIAGALAIALISLLVTPSITFDPTSWVVWAREFTGPLPFDTTGGPSWHPLPVFLIIPFTLINHTGADVYYWLAISRFCAMLAVVAAFVLGTRLAGLWAGVLGAVLMIFSPWWLYYGTVGGGEAMSAGVALCAVWAAVEGRHRLAAVLALAVGLIRPESWPFVFAYLMWLAYRRTLPRWTFPVAVAGTLLSWAVPNLMNSGGGAASAAMAAPVKADAIHARIPFIRVFEIAAQQLGVVPAVLVAVGIAMAAWALLWRPRHTILDSRGAALIGRRGQAFVEATLGPAGILELALIVIGVGWVLVVALETQILRFPGNPRYLQPGLAMLVVIAAVTAVRLAVMLARRFAGSARLLVPAVVLATAVLAVITTTGWMDRNITQINRRTTLVAQIRKELTQLNCPGRIWTRWDFPWLAEMTGQTNQQARRPGRFPGPGNGKIVSCAPPNAPPPR